MSKNKKTAGRHDTGQPHKDKSREQGRSTERRQDLPGTGSRQNISDDERDMDRGNRKGRVDRSDERGGVL